MTLDVDICSYWCPASGLPVWDGESTHHLIASGPPGHTVLICRYCRVPAIDLAAGLTYAEVY